MANLNRSLSCSRQGYHLRATDLAWRHFWLNSLSISGRFGRLTEGVLWAALV